MAEDVLDGGALGEERDQPHLALAMGTDEREDLVDACQQCCPHAHGGGTCAGGGRFLLSVLGRWGDGHDSLDGLIGACGHRGPQPGVGSQHAVVAVAVDAWRRDQQDEPVDQLERIEAEETPGVFGRGFGSS